VAETTIIYVEQRRICWPDPDWCCLEGGCGYCNDGPFKNIGAIANYARKAGVKVWESGETRDYWASFRYGQRWGWPNTQQRVVPRRVSA
jgi:hypothetical protein